MSWAIGRLWLNKSTKQITRDYNFITISFLVIGFFLYSISGGTTIDSVRYGNDRVDKTGML
jgi:hypothetical protein